MSDTFTCAICDGTFLKGWSEEEAEAEFVQNFGISKDDVPTDLVCDDCYHKMGFD